MLSQLKEKIEDIKEDFTDRRGGKGGMIAIWILILILAGAFILSFCGILK